MTSSKRALFPGTFDPFTVGHESIVRRGLALFEEVVIAVGNNSAKQTYFSIEKRMAMIKKVFEDEPRITVVSYEGLTVEFARKIGIKNLLRGLRTAADFEYERAIAQVNKKMTGIESVFLLTSPEHTPVNSTIVREILRHGGDVSAFIPDKLNISDYID
jgi:pantetheine-phosphate adenylyltransferase